MKIKLFGFNLQFYCFRLVKDIYGDGSTQNSVIWFRVRTPWTLPKEPNLYWWDITIANQIFSLGIFDFRYLKKEI